MLVTDNCRDPRAQYELSSDFLSEFLIYTDIDTRFTSVAKRTTPGARYQRLSITPQQLAPAAHSPPKVRYGSSLGA